MFDILPPKQCLITSDEIPEISTLNKSNTLIEPYESVDSEIPEKYKKMLNMGIPIGSVRQKCILDGVDPNILISGASVKNKNTVKPVNIGISNLLGELSTVKLNKVSSNTNRQIPKKPANNTLVPSLDDILHIKSQLRSIK